MSRSIETPGSQADGGATGEKVSVIIPTKNRSNYLVDAIRSVQSQTYSAFEIIVIDDGSTEPIRDVIHSFSGIRIQYIRTESAGPAKARNLAIKAAAGEFVAFLDSDDLWLPKKLEIQMDAIRRYPDTDMVFGRYDFIDKTNSLVGESKFWPESLHATAWTRLLLDGMPIATSGVLVKKNSLNDIGLFDESLKQSEDFDLWLRLSMKRNVRYVNEKLSQYRLHDHSLVVHRSEVWSWVLKVVEKHRVAMKSMGIPVNRYFSKFNLLLGQALIRQGNRGRGVMAVIRAITMDLLYMPAWRGLFKSLIPLGALKRILRGKQSGSPNPFEKYY